MGCLNLGLHAVGQSCQFCLHDCQLSQSLSISRPAFFIGEILIDVALSVEETPPSYLRVQGFTIDVYSSICRG